MNRVVFFILSVLFFSCKKEEINENVLVSFRDKFITRTELKKHILESNFQDSALFTKQYINNWVEEQLLVEEAKSLASEEIETKINRYRNSLLIEELKHTKMNDFSDTLISENEYKLFADSFQTLSILPYPLYKGVFFRLRGDTPLKKIETLLHSTKLNLKELHLFGVRYAESFILSDTSWLSGVYLKKKLGSDYALKLENSKTGFVKIPLEEEIIIASIKQYKEVGSVAPLEWSKKTIKSIIINKRKKEYFQNYLKQLKEGTKDEIKIY